MARIDTLRAAIAKQEAAIRRWLAAPSTVKRDAAIRTDLRTLMGYVDELAELVEKKTKPSPTPSPTPTPVVVPTVVGPTPPDSSLSMADRNRAWRDQRADYAARVAQITVDSPGTDAQAEFDLLKESGLEGIAVALGHFGPPGVWGIDYSAGDAWGGYWGASENQPDSGVGYIATIWAGSEAIYTGEPTPGPSDISAIGFANGLNAALDGPA